MFAGVPAPMLARLERTLPRGPLWRYEPKLDGFRGLLWRPPSGPARLLSRNVKELSAAFPELVRAGEALPPDSLLDGEIVIADAQGRSDFGALQRRLGLARRDAAKLAQASPAVLLAFDVLRHAGRELTDQPFGERRGRLELLLENPRPCVQLIAQTCAVDEAQEWLRLLPDIEGVVAKRLDGRYRAGERDWIKVKRQRTIDCVVIGVAGDFAWPWLVLGLRHADANLHHFGLARTAKDRLTASVLAPLLANAGPEETPIRSRWQHAAVPVWRRVPPTLVCEVAFTTLDATRWLRQPARFIRWRPDRSPDECWLDQLDEC